MYPHIRSYGFFALALAMLAPVRGEEEVAKEDDWSWLPPRKTREQIAPEEWAGMKQITERYPRPATAPGVEAQARAGKSRSYFTRYAYAGDDLKRPETWKDLTAKHLEICEKYNMSMFPDLARICHTDPTEEGRQKARELFLKQARFSAGMEEQNSGSGQSYRIMKVNMTENILAMADVLKEAGLYDDLVRAWGMHQRFMLKEYPKENMDWSRDRIPMAWALVANMDDGPEKLYYLRLLQRATSTSHALLLSPDGGGIHHNMDHLSYASYSFAKLYPVAIKAMGTPFQLTEEVHANLRAYAWAHALASVGVLFPDNLAGRPNLVPTGLPQQETWLREMAQAMDTPDRMLASMYLAKFDDSAGQLARFGGPVDEQAKAAAGQFRKEGVEPFSLRAHHSYNISAAAIHRRPEWVVSVNGTRAPLTKGMEHYQWPGSPRSFMSNMAFGSVQILRRVNEADLLAARKKLETEHQDETDPEAKEKAIQKGVYAWRNRAMGYVIAGWDYNHYPGVTAAVVPLHQLSLLSYSDRRPNNSDFCGGTSLGENGIWGMIRARRPGQALWRKSAFCFDNRITVLTSDISYPVSPGKKGKRPPSYPVHTTLFQFAMVERKGPAELDGEMVEAFPFEKEMPLDRAVHLSDHKGNAYTVHPAPESRLFMARRSQHSFHVLSLREDTPEEVTKLRARRMRPEALERVLNCAKPNVRPRLYS